MGWPYTEALDAQENAFEEILSWLPPADLLRYKLVKKSWNTSITSLVQHKPFAVKEVHNSFNRIISPSTTLVFRRGRACRTHRAFDHQRPLTLLTLFHDDVPVRFETRAPELPTLDPELFDPGLAKTYRHCNGIICLVDMTGTVLLCNPEIRRHRVIQNTGLDDHPRGQIIHGLESGHRVTQGLGFGYDSGAREYKLVLVYATYKGKSVWSPGAEVYDLSTRSRRDVGCTEKGVPDNFHWGLDDGAYCAGVYYWLVKGLGHKRVVLSFDFGTEEFAVVPLPALPGSSSGASMGAEWTSASWKETFVVFASCAVGASGGSPEMRCVEAWAMVVGGGWKKLFSAGPFARMRAPLTLWKKDELLLSMQNGEIVTWNVRSRRLKGLGVDKDDCMVYWGPYVESVASLVN